MFHPVRVAADKYILFTKDWAYVLHPGEPRFRLPGNVICFCFFKSAWTSRPGQCSGVGSVAAGAAMAAPLFKKWLSASCSLPVTSVVSCANACAITPVLVGAVSLDYSGRVNWISDK